MTRERSVRIVVVACVVLVVAAALGLATRERPGPPAGPPAPGGPMGKVTGTGAATTTPPAGDSHVESAPATTGGTGGSMPGLPPDHPEIAPAPDEKSQVSLQYLGHAAFAIQSPGQIVVLTDPFDTEFTGYSDPQARAHLVTVSHEHQDHNAARTVLPFTAMGRGSVRVIREGSAREGDVTVTAVPSHHDASGGSARGPNRIFRIEAGAIRIAHLGDLGHTLTPEQVTALGRVDVLLIPVGGHFTIGPDQAAEVVRQLNPRLAIPMHYRTPATRRGLAERLRPVEEFTVKFADVQFRDDYVALVALNTLPKATAVWVLKYRDEKLGSGGGGG